MARTGRRGEPAPRPPAARGGEAAAEADERSASPRGPVARDRLLWIVSLALFAAWFLFLLQLAMRD